MRRIAVFLVACVLRLGVPPVLASQSRWSVDAAPVLDIAGTTRSGGVAFGTAVWATRLASGVIVVADPGAPGLQYFDSRGEFLRTVGHAGQGPGDFRSVSWVAQCGRDSVFAWDLAQSRVTTFDAGGKLGRTFALGSRGGIQTTSACNGAGSFVVLGTPRRLPPPAPPDPAAGYFILTFAAPVQVVDAAGGVRAATPELPAGEAVGGMGGRGGGMPRPLGQTTVFALSASRLFVGNGDSAAVRVYSFDGRRTGTITLGAAGRAPTKAQYERAADNLLALVPGAMRETARQWILTVPMPATIPPYSALFTDPDGLLWVDLSMPGDQDTRFRVVRESGAAVADVAVPASLTVFEIGADYILGVHEDASGEQHVRMYRLHRAR